MILLVGLCCIMFAVFYIVKYNRYYRLAFQFPRAHPYIPNVLSGVIFLVANHFDVYQMLRRMNVSGNVEHFSVWLPSLTTLIKRNDHCQTVFTSKHLIDKSFHYEGISQLLGPTGLITSKGSGEVYRNSKKIFHQAFNGRSHEIIMHSLLRGKQQLLGTLDEEERKKEWFKFMPIIKHTTTRIILDNALDMRLPEGDPLYSAIEKNYESYLMNALIGAFLDQIPLISKVFSFKKKVKEASTSIEKHLNGIYTKKVKSMSDRKVKNEDVPNQFIYNILQERKNYPINFIFDDMSTVVFAALDTTAITIASCVVMLGMHPEVQEKVFKEDQEIQKELRGREMLEESEFQKYEYLHRVIKESLRLFPPVPLLARHVNEEVQLGRCTLPKDSSVVLYVPFVHRDHENYPNPTRFDPDRFLPENVEKRHKLAYLPFSYGQRQCLGIRYATQSAIYLVSSIARNFKIISKYRTVEEMDENLRGFITLSDIEGFSVRLEKRV